jgi:hypothetical protein
MTFAIAVILSSQVSVGRLAQHPKLIGRRNARIVSTRSLTSMSLGTGLQLTVQADC